MSANPCIETISVVNRKIQNLDYHNARFNKTRKALWGLEDRWDLSNIEIPDSVTDLKHKLRITYAHEIETVQWSIHEPREIRSIKKVYIPDIDYTFKYCDRSLLANLFEQRGDADEILIIHNGMVSDSFFGNVALANNSGWYTPTSYLLAGTQRAYLLDQGIIKEQSISEKDLKDYTHLRIINALMDWNNTPTLEIGMVV